MDTENVEDKVEHFEKRTSEIYERLTSRKQSSIVLQYLLNLGKELDKDGFFIKTNFPFSSFAICFMAVL